MLKKSGFTLVEIMIVVAIIGVLVALSIPAFQKAREVVQINRFIADIRVAADAFTMYSMDNASYPADEIPGNMPEGMAGYLAKMDWTGTTVIGGQWDWDLDQFGFHAGVSVYQPNWSDEKMRLIDERLDDGNLNTGLFRQRQDGFIYVIDP